MEVHVNTSKIHALALKYFSGNKQILHILHIDSATV